MDDSRLDRLYALLPAIHRIRDQESGQALRALLQIVGEQVNVIEDDIARLYDNWFIETCEDWVVPYIGDLIGYEPVQNTTVLTPRREVANTLRYRRRKGTLALLELLARDVAGWPARAVEFERLVARASTGGVPFTGARATADVRAMSRGPGVSTAFDPLAHLSDVRRIADAHGAGEYGVPNVGVFLWRLGAYSITRAPARCVEEAGPNCYAFSALGNDTPLYNRPRVQSDPDAIAGPRDVPAPIDRQAFTEERVVGNRRERIASADYYGLVDDAGTAVAQSIAIWAEDWPPGAANADGLVARERIIPADLSGWGYVPPKGHIAVDPVRGRFVFPIRQLPKRGVWVSYDYGFSADIGGGEYERPMRQAPGARVIRVEGKEALQRALEPWKRLTDAAGDDAVHPDQPEHAVIEIADSGVYVLPINIYLGAGHSLQIRAAQRTRPVLRLLDWQTDLPDNLSVAGKAASRFILDGVMVAGRGVQIERGVASLIVRHSTLVPGWSLEPNCDPERPAEPSIELIDSTACVVIEHSIVGSIQINNSEVASDPVTLQVSDSIVDATGTECDSPECEAIGASGSALAFAELCVVRSTVIGRVMVHAIRLAEDSIFLSRVVVARRQVGCMRFCYVHPGSRTPQRFQCQPDLVERAAEARLTALGAGAAEVDAERRLERSRVRPQFVSTRYGMPTYAQLASTTAAEILRGAEDESEMGVFHDLFQPQRMASLRVRLDEFVPAATDVGVILVT